MAQPLQFPLRTYFLSKMIIFVGTTGSDPTETVQPPLPFNLMLAPSFIREEMCSDLIFNCVYSSTLFYSCSIHVFNLVLVLYRIFFFIFFIYFFYPGLDGTPLPPPLALECHVLDYCRTRVYSPDQ